MVFDQVHPLCEFWEQTEQGDARSQYEIGAKYTKGEWGITQDYGEAFKWFKKAATQGHVDGQDRLARIYQMA